MSLDIRRIGHCPKKLKFSLCLKIYLFDRAVQGGKSETTDLPERNLARGWIEKQDRSGCGSMERKTKERGFPHYGP